MTEFNIALVSEEFPPFTFGGIGAACHDLAYALSRNGVRTTVFCGRANELTTENINDNLRIIRLPCYDKPPRFLWFQLQNLKSFSKLFKDYSVLHIVNPEAGAITAYVAKHLKLPLVTSIHGVYVYPLNKNINFPFSGWTFADVGLSLFGLPVHETSIQVCLKLSDRLAVCNMSTVAELKTLYPWLNLKKVSVIPNGINFETIPKRTIDRDLIDNHSIIFYGRLIGLKGVQYVLVALENLKEEFPDIKLHVFGDGPFRKRIDELILNLNLSNQVIMHGKVPRTELWKEISKAALVVLPSMHEAQPISMLEAMAFNKALIAFDYPFSRDIIKNMHNGILAKAADAEDLTKMIRLVLNQKDLRIDLGNNGRNYVEEKHNWDTLAKRYIQLYQNTIDDFAN